ncbi:MAG: TM2 domain-containing protein [Gammaproteobacteria bacterium]|nr:TM2 domain-containing protein [Gammaproteobacteria bacterium]
MSSAWEEIDLHGKGVQSVNKRFIRARKRPLFAYLLWFLFPLGAHRIYLQSALFAAIYSSLSAISLILYLTETTFAWLPLLSMGVLAVVDLVWIDRRIIQINKELRSAIYLQQDKDTMPDANFRGKYSPDHDDYLRDYTDIKNSEIPADKRVGQDKRGKSYTPSFAEQEALLRELARQKQARTEK